MKKEELRNVDGTDALHPSRAAMSWWSCGRPISSTRRRRAGGSRSRSSSASMATCRPRRSRATTSTCTGRSWPRDPGIRAQNPVAGVRAIDLAPTIAFLLGIPGPQNARGEILYRSDMHPGYKRDHDPRHQRLPRPAGAASPRRRTTWPAPAPSTRASISAARRSSSRGSTRYRAEAADGSITVAAGDSVGATPPISAFFGDTPTIEMMNLMGFDLDGLGNHNFDKG